MRPAPLQIVVPGPAYVIGPDPQRSGFGMGAFLDKPKTDKTNAIGEGNGVRFSVSHMQGWRVEMEDAHTAVIRLQQEGPLKEWSYFAVFDGHAGAKVAQHSSQVLLKIILDTPELKEVALELGKNGGLLNEKLSNLVKRGMRVGFLELDESMKNEPEVYGDTERSGTTAVCCLLAPTAMFIANLGDSRAIVCRNGESTPFGTADHKPFLPKERDRIVKAGGSVMIQRVNGSLAVSRALGDYEYKQVPGLLATEQLVSPEPDVYPLERHDDDQFLLIACDGVYDVMTNQELAEFVRSRMLITDNLSAIGNQILDTCLSKGSRDNMSVILVTFPGAPQVCDSAKKAEVELHDQLKKRIQGIVSMCEKVSDIETDYVLRILINQDIPGMPPGAGIHAVRSQVDQILENIKAASTRGNAAAVGGTDNQAVKNASFPGGGGGGSPTGVIQPTSGVPPPPGAQSATPRVTSAITSSMATTESNPNSSFSENPSKLTNSGKTSSVVDHQPMDTNPSPVHSSTGVR